jgi:predicted AAA+ superfamily ATPase
MSNPISEHDFHQLLSSLNRIATALDSGNTSTQIDNDFSAIAYRWKKRQQFFEQSYLVPINTPQLISFDSLKNIDQQQNKLIQNTLQFVNGLPANNVLMSGSRGTGKSSLVRACLEKFHHQGLRLIEVEKAHLDDLPDIVDLIRNREERFIIFCDDLSFEEGDHSYKGLKTVLDGSTAGPSENILVYATSNRRKMVSERMSDNLNRHHDDQGEVHPNDSIEEKISLSERFGITLHFYNFNQDEYLVAVLQWLRHFEMDVSDTENITTLALLWAGERGARSGRIAWQFAVDYVGKEGVKNLDSQH